MNYPHTFERLTDPSEAPPKVGIHWINKLSIGEYKNGRKTTICTNGS